MTIENLMGMPVIWHPDCLLHQPEGEVWLGMWETGTEVPQRATTMLEAVTSNGADIRPATAHADDAVLAVHDATLVEPSPTCRASSRDR